MPGRDDDLVGMTIETPTQRGRIVVASRMLDIAMVAIIDADGKPTGAHGVLPTLKSIQKVA